MAEQTTSAEALDRAEAADRLNDVASALRAGDEFSVRVGNKDVGLRPSEPINYRVDVIERQRRFRGDRETVRIELDWKPEG
ncbi:amphi-Trp domain-containing protein [Halobacteriales archaeon QS_8_69_26]|nr:MAG: amphi-Trp domain-containing protein [Halobacteriales archaeon QS_8_69_26]